MELMIALAVSGVILTAGITALSGRQSTTEFNQSIYDLQSKFQSYISQVANKAIPGYQQYTCSAGSSGRPVLTANTSGQVSNCIYLGEAIQIVDGKELIYAYPIFGFRTYTDASGNVGFPYTIDQATPEPAVDSSGAPLLVDTYTMLNGLKTISTSTTTDTNDNDLLTIYANLQSGNTSGNETLATAYRQLTTAQNFNQAKSCVEDSSCSASTSLNNSAWQICVGDGAKTAKLTLRGTATGLTTNLIITACT